RDELVELALELVAVDTANPPGEVDPAAAIVEGYLQDRGIATERVAVDPAKPNVVAELTGERAETLGFNGHLDTVPYEAEVWTRHPLGERVEDRLYGRGSSDMKGPLAAMLVGAAALLELERRPPVSLAWSFVADEEVGGDAGLAAVLDAGRFDVDACVIGEPTCRGDRHSITVADRGSIWLTLESTGEAAHGSRPMLGENAIDRLYGAIDRIRDLVGSRRFDLSPSIRPIVAESAAFYAPDLGETAAQDLFDRPTINLGRLEGGEAINQVPRRARAEVDIRLTAGVDTRSVLADVRECIDDCSGISLVDVSWSVGTAESLEAPLVRATTAVAESLTGDRVYRRSATGGGDAKRLRQRGTSTVEFALGPDTAHAVDEYTTVEALVANAKAYAQLPFRYAEYRFEETATGG
ncbi:MAG: M20 family metallopeptidase, partial [Halobacteriota archaeon]